MKSTRWLISFSSHASHWLSRERVNSIERMRILFEPDIRIPVSEQYKEAFQNYLDKNFLV